MTQAPAFEAWDQPARAEGRWRGNAQDFGFTAIGAQGNGLTSRLAWRIFLTSTRYKSPAGVIWQASAYPTKQQALQQLFELRHLLTDGTLGQIPVLRRPE